MKSKILMTALLATMSVSAMAGVQIDGAAGEITARVIMVDPVYENVTTYRNEQQCRTEQVPVYGQARSGNTAGMIIGGIIGGLAGSTMGKGNGNKAMIGLGAATGAMMGNTLPNNSGQVIGYQQIQNCSMVQVPSTSRQLSHYGVTIEFEGETALIYTRNRYRVGEYITVRKQTSYDVEMD